jgi:hypothetical protein
MALQRPGSHKANRLNFARSLAGCQKDFLKRTLDFSQDNTHIIAIVLFGFSEDDAGQPVPNNYITTAYQKEIG